MREHDSRRTEGEECGDDCRGKPSHNISHRSKSLPALG
jgi:hypothetical protein